MPTFEIKIKGIVQGVGFRPFVFNLAHEKGLTGWVLNGSQGVVIRINTNNSAAADSLLSTIVAKAPPLAVIEEATCQPVDTEHFQDFTIRESAPSGDVDIPLTPDYALCEKCRADLAESANRRYGYGFTTCTLCGPRYSIIKSIPYDRPETTMQKFSMCESCHQEYDNPADRRYYSQTNSCEACGISLTLYSTDSKSQMSANDNEIIKLIAQALVAGKIIAVKGIGGYLLMVDARSEAAVERLRSRKQRPKKPLAVLYPSLADIINEFNLSSNERKALQNEVAPIVLLQPRKDQYTLCNSIAKGLDKVGVMLPYAPLLQLIANTFGGPLVATSGNVSGSPIIYEDQQAQSHLGKIADLILTHDRQILIPQDDSVWQYSPVHSQRIILRRSRGMAPNYLHQKKWFKQVEGAFATGAQMKGAFAFIQKGRCYSSQYLGSMEHLHAQESWQKVFDHLQSVVRFKPNQILLDKHPGYFGHQWREQQPEATSRSYYHHRAHFAALLGEHDLFDVDNMLGFVWDGTGLGEDGQVWGSETFIYQDKSIRHLGNQGYFTQLAGDKMSLDPAMSALSAVAGAGLDPKHLKQHFSNKAWALYHYNLSHPSLYSSSMGRLFDAVGFLIFGIEKNSYEGETAMRLEVLARQSLCKKTWNLKDDEPFYKQVIEHVCNELESSVAPHDIAMSFHLFLVEWIDWQAQNQKVKHLGFSGGVFQNSLLIDLIITKLVDRYELYFHNDLSPNDENIAFGQLGLHYLELQNTEQSDHKRVKVNATRLPKRKSIMLV